MGNVNVTKQTLAALKKCQAVSIKKADGLTMESGLSNYDLQPAAKLLYPVLSPLRNETPRVKGNGGDATHWKAITGVNTTNISMGVAEGRRNAVMVTATEDYNAPYATLGLENSVTDEAIDSGEGFDDLRALCAKNLLEATIIGEEAVLLGGNYSLKLGKTETPVLSANDSGGFLGAAKTIAVIAVGLSFDGFNNASIQRGVPGLITRENADGTKDTYGGGSAQKSEAATVTTGAGSTNAIAASTSTIKGAVAYAWYWGVSGAERLGAITTINSVVITEDAQGEQLASELSNADNSTNKLLMDGFLTQSMKGGGYYKAMPTGTPGEGTGLTPDKSAGIVEFDDALKSFWDTYRVSPDEILCNAQEIVNVTRKIIENGGSPLFRFNIDGNSEVTLTAGTVVGQYLNRFAMNGGQLLMVKIHPNMPAGTVMFRRKTIPYPMSNITNVAEVKYQRDYYQTEWPRRTRSYEYGIYAREALAVYAPFCFGVITNIANR